MSAKDYRIPVVGLFVGLAITVTSLVIPPAYANPPVCKNGTACTYYTVGGGNSGTCGPGSDACYCTYQGVSQVQAACAGTS